MAPQNTNPERQISSYEPLDDKIGDFDLENDSDDTLTSTGFLNKNNTATKGGKRARKQRGTQMMLVWLRWGTVVVLQSVIVCLMLLSISNSSAKNERWTQAETETGGDINGLYVPSEFPFAVFCSNGLARENRKRD